VLRRRLEEQHVVVAASLGNVSEVQYRLGYGGDGGDGVGSGVRGSPGKAYLMRVTGIRIHLPSTSQMN